jgi:hypothetical protein
MRHKNTATSQISPKPEPPKADRELQHPVSFDTACEIRQLKKQLEECDNHLRKVLLGAAKVSRPSYHDKRAFDRFQKWRDDCHEAEKWRILSLYKDKVEK